jgi:hypothetical protein
LLDEFFRHGVSHIVLADRGETHASVEVTLIDRQKKVKTPLTTPGVIDPRLQDRGNWTDERGNRTELRPNILAKAFAQLRKLTGAARASP